MPRVLQRYIVPLLMSALVIGCAYYIDHPPMNIQSESCWWFVIFSLTLIESFLNVGNLRCTDDWPLGEVGTIVLYVVFIAVYMLCYLLFRVFMILANVMLFLVVQGAAAHADVSQDDKPFSVSVCVSTFIGAVALILVVVGGIIGIASSEIPFDNGKEYAKVLQVENGNFADDISEISMKNVPVVDKDTAMRLGNRTLGEMADIVSQYDIDDNIWSYAQINYNNTPYRVAPLTYNGIIIKWLANHNNGIPGYITVNMATQDTKLVRLDADNAIRYSTCEYFDKEVRRHVQFQYPTDMFNTPAFEIDDSGHPYWICPVKKKTFLMFGAEDIESVVICDAVSGECTKYALEDVPQWVDKVYDADLVNAQINWYGALQGGWLNSIFGQSGVTKHTKEYNYLALNDDVYMYTGMTSATGDESLVGFMLTNLRTHSTKYYSCAGATESSAMESAKGQVQQMNYTPTAPLLLNIADRPTYFLSLKDDAGLVKMYAFVDVQQYQIVGTGTTVSSAQENYIAALATDDQVDVNVSDLKASADLPSASGTIADLKSVGINGNTYYYFMLEGDSNVYTVYAALDPKVPFWDKGTSVNVLYNEANGVRDVTALVSEDKPQETAEQ